MKWFYLIFLFSSSIISIWTFSIFCYKKSRIAVFLPIFFLSLLFLFSGAFIFYEIQISYFNFLYVIAGFWLVFNIWRKKWQ